MQFRQTVLARDRHAIDVFLARVEQAVGYALLGEEASMGLYGDTGAPGWLAEDGGELVGLVQSHVGRDSTTVDVVIAPWSSGVVGRLLEVALRSLPEGVVRAWVSDSRTAAAASEAGLRRGRSLVRLERRLPFPETPEVPSEVRVVAWRPDADEGAYLVVANDAFAGHPESGGWTRATFAERASRPWFDADGLFLAWERGTPVGACWTKVHPGGVGEIYSIAVRPSAAGKGLGRALVLTGFDYLVERRGVGRGMLWADCANRAAVSLYERLGMQPVRERTEMLLEA